VRWKLDENVPMDAAELLRAVGHDCQTVYSEQLSGAPDERLMAVRVNERRVLLTLDLDFADIRRYPPGEYAGILVLRPAEPDAERVLRLVARALRVLATEPIDQRLWIVEEERIRIRGSDDAAV
jgi:predicted nuclease of predicted toxin-antitoxin system